MYTWGTPVNFDCQVTNNPESAKGKSPFSNNNENFITEKLSKLQYQ